MKGHTRTSSDYSNQRTQRDQQSSVHQQADEVDELPGSADERIQNNHNNNNNNRKTRRASSSLKHKRSGQHNHTNADANSHSRYLSSRSSARSSARSSISDGTIDFSESYLRAGLGDDWEGESDPDIDEDLSETLTSLERQTEDVTNDQNELKSNARSTERQTNENRVILEVDEEENKHPSSSTTGRARIDEAISGDMSFEDDEEIQHSISTNRYSLDNYSIHNNDEDSESLNESVLLNHSMLTSFEVDDSVEVSETLREFQEYIRRLQNELVRQQRYHKLAKKYWEDSLRDVTTSQAETEQRCVEMEKGSKALISELTEQLEDVRKRFEAQSALLEEKNFQWSQWEKQQKRQQKRASTADYSSSSLHVNFLSNNLNDSVSSPSNFQRSPERHRRTKTDMPAFNYPMSPQSYSFTLPKLEEPESSVDGGPSEKPDQIQLRSQSQSPSLNQSSPSSNRLMVHVSDNEAKKCECSDYATQTLALDYSIDISTQTSPIHTSRPILSHSSLISVSIDEDTSVHPTLSPTRSSFSQTFTSFLTPQRSPLSIATPTSLLMQLRLSPTSASPSPSSPVSPFPKGALYFGASPPPTPSQEQISSPKPSSLSPVSPSIGKADAIISSMLPLSSSSPEASISLDLSSSQNINAPETPLTKEPSRKVKRVQLAIQIDPPNRSAAPNLPVAEAVKTPEVTSSRYTSEHLPSSPNISKLSHFSRSFRSLPVSEISVIPSQNQLIPSSPAAPFVNLSPVPSPLPEGFEEIPPSPHNLVNEPPPEQIFQLRTKNAYVLARELQSHPSTQSPSSPSTFSSFSAFTSFLGTYRNLIPSRTTASN